MIRYISRRRSKIPAGPTVTPPGPPPTAFYYLRYGGGTYYYIRPDGFKYIRPPSEIMEFAAPNGDVYTSPTGDQYIAP